jgi:hypothetical protein
MCCVVRFAFTPISTHALAWSFLLAVTLCAPACFIACTLCREQRLVTLNLKMISTTAAMSSPADPGATSYLDLPAELRNWVYEAYLKYDEKVHLAYDGKGTITAAWRPKNRQPNWPTGYDNMTPNTTKSRTWPRKTYARQIQLLRVCKQIHEEAASMLYSNKFYIAKSIDAHPVTHDTTGHYVNQTPTIWLRQIGQHKYFVRRLVIDLGSTCPSGCDGTDQTLGHTFRRTDGYLQFGDLLRAIWASDLKIAITFVAAARHCHIRFEDVDHQNSPTSQALTDAERLSKTFEALAKDELDMKKFRRVIGDIGITPNGTGGIFVFWTPGWRYIKDHAQTRGHDDVNPLLDHARSFSSDEEGKLSFNKKTSDSKGSYIGLLDLPRSVLTQVVEYTLYSSTPRELDLDSFADMKDLYGVLYSDMCIHNSHIVSFLHDSTFNLSIMTSDAIAKFDFSKLERLLQTLFQGYFNGERHTVRFGALDHYSINLIVHFRTPGVVSSFSNIRINITNIVTCTFYAGRERAVRIWLYNGTSVLRGHVSTVDKLRSRVSSVLSKYVKKDHPHDHNIRCPEIWINGHGKIVDVVHTGYVEGESVANPAKTNPTLWSAESTGSYVGAKPPVMPKADGLARDMYLYLKWIS